MSGRFHFSPPLLLLPKGCHWPSRTNMAIGPHPLPAYFPPIRANTGHLTVSNASIPPTALRLKLESLAMAAKPPVTWCPLPLGTHFLPLSPWLWCWVSFLFLKAVSCFLLQSPEHSSSWNRELARSLGKHFHVNSLCFPQGSHHIL